VVLVAASVGALVVTGRNGSRSVSAQTAEGRIDAEVGALLAGIPQHGNTLGQPTAPFTLEIFADLECLTVKNWIVLLLPAVIREFVRSNIVQIQYRSLETDTEDPTVFLAQQSAALAAGSQDKAWNFIEIFYHEQGKEYTPYVTDNYLEGIASQVSGLNISQWISDRTTHLVRQVVADNNTARNVGFRSTPSFLIGRTGGGMTKLVGHRVVIDFRNTKTGRQSKAYLVEPGDITEALDRLP